mmetsp:Transcript_63660/g.201304  ORF Transcript_63660/g.201304 Transcript_63660/m.201304 type:complete len:203 (+) Transcript_63660:1947-2555(+)
MDHCACGTFAATAARASWKGTEALCSASPRPLTCSTAARLAWCRGMMTGSCGCGTFGTCAALTCCAGTTAPSQLWSWRARRRRARGGRMVRCATGPRGKVGSGPAPPSAAVPPSARSVPSPTPPGVRRQGWHPPQGSGRSRCGGARRAHACAPSRGGGRWSLPSPGRPGGRWGLPTQSQCSARVWTGSCGAGRWRAANACAP